MTKKRMVLRALMVLANLAALYVVLAAVFTRENGTAFLSEKEALASLYDGNTAMVEQVTKGDKNVYVMYDPSTGGVFAVTVAGRGGGFRLENQTAQYALRDGESMELTYPVENMVLHLKMERDGESKPGGYRIADTTVTS